MDTWLLTRYQTSFIPTTQNFKTFLQTKFDIVWDMLAYLCCPPAGGEQWPVDLNALFSSGRGGVQEGWKVGEGSRVVERGKPTSYSGVALWCAEGLLGRHHSWLKFAKKLVHKVFQTPLTNWFFPTITVPEAQTFCGIFWKLSPYFKEQESVVGFWGEDDHWDMWYWAHSKLCNLTQNCEIRWKIGWKRWKDWNLCRSAVRMG